MNEPEKVLIDSQRQLDEEGVEVGVSRQALYEVLDSLAQERDRKRVAMLEWAELVSNEIKKSEAERKVRVAAEKRIERLTDAVTAYRADVEGGSYPGPEHSYED